MIRLGILDIFVSKDDLGIARAPVDQFQLEHLRHRGIALFGTDPPPGHHNRIPLGVQVEKDTQIVEAGAFLEVQLFVKWCDGRRAVVKNCAGPIE